MPKKSKGQSVKECDRCQAQTKSGNQCRNRTCKSDRCWQHLKRDDGLRIKSSQVPGGGMGLWTTRRYKPNEQRKHRRTHLMLILIARIIQS